MAQRGPISDAAIERATGKKRERWYAVLDGVKGDRTHRSLAQRLAAAGAAPWWSQMLTVEYERERGLRDRLQRADESYEAGVQRTVPVSREEAFAAFADAKRVGTWFSTKVRQDVRVGGTYRNGDGDRGKFLAVVPPRRLRFTWDNPEHSPGSVVEVTFLAKGPARTVVHIAHGKLQGLERADEMRKGWTWALASLVRWLETGKGLPYAEWAKSRERVGRRKRA